MSTLMSLMVVGAAAIAARRIYKNHQKEKRLKIKLAKIAEERFQEWLKKNRIPKLKQGELGDVVMCVHPEDREHYFDSNITRWSRPNLDSSWGFCGTGPHLMAEDILFHFTNDARFSQWGEPVRAVVEELICFVPLNGGTIKFSEIKPIIERYWDKFDTEISAMSKNLEAHGLRAQGLVHRPTRPSFLAATSKSVHAEGHKCS